MAVSRNIRLGCQRGSLVIREDFSPLIFMLVFTVLKKRKQSQPSNSSVISTTEALGCDCCLAWSVKATNGRCQQKEGREPQDQKFPFIGPKPPSQQSSAAVLSRLRHPVVTWSPASADITLTTAGCLALETTLTTTYL